MTLGRPDEHELETGEIRPLARITGASNIAFLVDVRHDGTGLAVFKPEAGERPLWDFPDGTLARRERAAYLVSRTGGWGLVPPTVLRDGPGGPGSLQTWIGDRTAPAPAVVDLDVVDEVPDDHLGIVVGEDEGGADVVVHHRDDPRLRSLAVLDAALNSSDRKAGHVLASDEGIHAIDNAVSLHVDPKLRTVLWAWAGQPLPEPDARKLETLAAALERDGLRDELGTLLTVPEIAALEDRVNALLACSVHPAPTDGWPPLPWPPA